MSRFSISSAAMLAVVILKVPLPVFGQESGSGATVPDEATQARIQRLVWEVYRDDHRDAETAQQRSELARRILQVATDTVDSDERFVLLTTAATISAEAGDYETTSDAVGRLANRYGVDALELKTEIFTEAVRSTTIAERRELLPSLLSLVSDAAAAEEYATASRIASSALSIARRARDSALTRAILQQKQEIDALVSWKANVETALSTLATNPDDAEAHEVVGEHLCFVKADWESGLAHLVAGTRPELRDLASRELSDPTDPADLLELGDAWWELSTTSTLPIAQRHQREHAAFLYRVAMPDLAGFSRARVEQRLAELAPATVTAVSPADEPRLADDVESPSTTSASGFARVQAEKGQFLPLTVGARLCDDREYFWSRIPESLAGSQFLRNPAAQQAVTRFRVLSPGIVYMAVTSHWTHRGLVSDGWELPYVSREQLERQGWREVEKLMSNELGRLLEWTVFERECRAGDAFGYRTEKYYAPILIVK